MTTYCEPEKETLALLETAMALYHQRLADNDVKVAILMAHAPVGDAGLPEGPAIKHHGVAALAKVRIIGLRDRAHGLADAEIILDGDVWPLKSDKERLAILDHELTHLELKVKDGAPQKDDLGRPKLGMRHHDHTFGWFDEVVARHGGDSVEHQQAIAFLDHAEQMWLPFDSITTSARRVVESLRDMGATMTVSVGGERL